MLKARQQRALAALLVSPSVAASATSSGVPLRTLERWLTDDEFKTELRAEQRRLRDHQRRRLQKLADQALDVLGEVMADTEAQGARVAAARSLLGFSRDLELDDIEQRLAALELQRLNAAKG